MKFILKQCLWWAIPLILYIIQIIFVAVNGPTLSNAICGWLSCIVVFIMLAFICISNLYDLHKKYEKSKREVDEKIQKMLQKREDEKINQKIEKQD